MASLVSLDRVKAALRVDSSDDDAMLTLYIEAASAAVISYLKDAAVTLIDSASDVPPQIVVATIMLVGHFYRDPDGDTEKEFDVGCLPRPVTSMLYALRDPALK